MGCWGGDWRLEIALGRGRIVAGTDRVVGRLVSGWRVGDRWDERMSEWVEGTTALVLLPAGHSKAFEWRFSYPFLGLFSGWVWWTERLDSYGV
jgi:hypothetical protein